MASRSIPAAVAHAQNQLANEPVRHKSARREIEQLWHAAEHLASTGVGEAGTGLARAAIHLEAVRRALRLLGGVDGATPDAQLWDAVPPEVRASLGIPDAELPVVASIVARGLEASTPAPVDAMARVHANAANRLNAEDRLVGNFVLKRFVRIGLLLVVGAGVAALVGAGVLRMIRAKDLAEGLPFITSSKMWDCNLDAGECGGHPAQALFHTKDEPNPWYQVDLQRPTDFTRMTIINRGDLAEERAIPLVIELSDDGAKFREVARKTEVFSTWNADLGPQNARFVRLRVDRKSFLHLQAVRVHP